MRALLVGLVILAVVVGLVVWGIGINNQLVTLQQNVNEKSAQVQNVYQRRADLIPNLVETVKGFAAQERNVLVEVTEARSKATSIQLTPETLNDPKAMERFQAAQGQLTGALSRLMVVVEKYPELKSNQNFLQLQSQLEGTENRIAVERRRFNEAVREYNTRLNLFPGTIVARLAGFRPKAFFEAALRVGRQQARVVVHALAGRGRDDQREGEDDGRQHTRTSPSAAWRRRATPRSRPWA